MLGLLLLLAFIVVPIVEITVIGQVQQLLGWPTTIVILVLDSVVGAYLVRLQGALAWRRFQTAAGEGRMPTEEVVDGALILFGGALMLTPGFVTDVVGLLAVFTPTRRLANRWLRRRVSVGGGPFGTFLTFGRSPTGDAGAGPRRGGRVRGGRTRSDRDAGQSRAERPRPPREPGVIDVEVVDVQRNPRQARDDAGPRASLDDDDT